MRGAIPAMPNVNILFRLFLGAPVRLVDAPRLAVAKADMWLFGKPSLVLCLKYGHVALHQLDAFLEPILEVYHKYF